MTQKIIDNKQNGILGDALKETLDSTSNVSIVSAYFTIYALKQLIKEFNKSKKLRFLLTQNPFDTSTDMPRLNPYPQTDEIRIYRYHYPYLRSFPIDLYSLWLYFVLLSFILPIFLTHHPSDLISTAWYSSGS